MREGVHNMRTYRAASTSVVYLSAPLAADSTSSYYFLNITKSMQEGVHKMR